MTSRNAWPSSSTRRGRRPGSSSSTSSRWGDQILQLVAESRQPWTPSDPETSSTSCPTRRSIRLPTPRPVHPTRVRTTSPPSSSRLRTTTAGSSSPVARRRGSTSAHVDRHEKQTEPDTGDHRGTSADESAGSTPSHERGSGRRATWLISTGTRSRPNLPPWVRGALLRVLPSVAGITG